MAELRPATEITASATTELLLDELLDASRAVQVGGWLAVFGLSIWASWDASDSLR